MATEVLVHFRSTREPVRLEFEEDEDWQVKDTERLVLILHGDKRPALVVNVQDFMFAKPTGDDGG